MSPEEYLDEIKTRLAEDDLVAQYTITREQFTSLNADIRVRLTFTDKSTLEFSEFIRANSQEDLDVVAYSYHWMSETHQIIRRWDNAEHYPNIENFPHHLHDADEKNVLPSEPMNILKVLDFIATRLNG